MDAFYRYDWKEGVKFGSYAVWYVRTRMSSTVHENDLVRVPVRLRKKVLRAMNAGEPIEKIRYGKEAASSMFHTFSMDLTVDTETDDDSGTITVADTVPDTDAERLPDYAHSYSLLKEAIDKEMDRSLTIEESKLLRRLYGLDGECTSLDDAAAEIGSSKDWARRAKARALAKLRDSRAINEFNTAGIY